MAQLSLTGGKGSFSWEISGLTWYFDTLNYKRAGIATQSVTGGATSISGVVDYVTAWDGNTSFSAEGSLSYPAGTYTFYGFTEGSDGTYWPTGSASVTVKEAASVTPWSWSTSNGQASDGQTQTAYQILLGELPVSAGFSHLVWNDLVDKTVQVRQALGLGWDTDGGNYLTQDGCCVSAGQTLSASVYNGLRFQIGSVIGTGIPDRVSGDEILGYHITKLAEVLNRIISEQL